MSERNIEIVREYNFDPKEVIAGLNGYYESDKRNGYIAIKRNDLEGPAYFTAALYRSALIEWLREDYDIFYRPGLIFDQIEAARNAAKMCCLRAHIKDEISKRGLWCTKDADIPELVDTLFKAYDECKELRDKNRKDAVKLSKENQELRKEVKDIILQDIMKYIRQESSRNGFYLPEEIDGEPLTIKRVFHDLLELLRMKDTKIKKLSAELAFRWTKTSLINWLQQRARHKGVELDDAFLYSDDAQYDWTDIVDFLFDEIVKMRGEIKAKESGIEDLKKRTAEIKEVRKKHWNDLRDIHKMLGSDGTYDNTDDFAKAVKARIECVKIALGEKSDINKLIREYCTKNGIIAPSRYLSDEACVEYLFSVIEQKDRSFAILQDLYRDIFKKQTDGLSAEDIATKILDRILTTEDLLHKSVDSVNKECKATGRMMVEAYKIDLKDYILKDIRKYGYRYDGLETKSVEEIVDRIIQIATCPRDAWGEDEIENLRSQITRLKGLINAMNEEVKDM